MMILSVMAGCAAYGRGCCWV